MKEMHGTSQVTICAHLGFPVMAKVGTPAAEPVNHSSQNIYIRFFPLQGKKGEKKNIIIIHGRERSLT